MFCAEKKFFFVGILISTILYVNGSIIIDMENEDLHRMGEILVESYFQHQLMGHRPNQMASRSIILSQIKKITFNGVQLFGIMMTLVGANLLTSYFEPIINIHSTNSVSVINTTTTSMSSATINPTKLCAYDYGCDKNVCWRTCSEYSSGYIDHHNKVHEEKMGEETAQSWCFTTSKPKEQQFHPCEFSYECSPCWSCLGPCHSPQP